MPKDFQIEYAYPTWYRAATTDGAVVSLLFDAFGETLSLVLFRTESQAISETATMLDDGRIQFVGGQTPETRIVRVMEVQALMRPDKAKDILVGLQTSLKGLPKERREFYGITDELLGIVGGAK
jgi:hypothetical protein